MKRDIEELTDILSSNNFGYGRGKQFRSHRVVIGETDDHWLLYAKSEGTQSALKKLFLSDWDVHISEHIMGEVIAYSETRVDL